jgi:hypothetical protein
MTLHPIPSKFPYTVHVCGEFLFFSNRVGITKEENQKRKRGRKKRRKDILKEEGGDGRMEPKYFLKKVCKRMC